MTRTTAEHTEKQAVIACGSLQHEFEQVLSRDPGAAPPVQYLDTDLHRTPSRISGVLQAAIDRLDNACDTIIIGYGLCSNGVVGIRTHHARLILPKVHDCLDLFLGFAGSGNDRGALGTTRYYLTPGTLLNQKDPLSMMNLEYAPKMGREKAEWGMKMELTHYTHFILMSTGRDDMDRIRQKARDNAAFFNMTLEEMPADLSTLDHLVYGPHDPGRFHMMGPGRAVTQEMFLETG